MKFFADTASIKEIENCFSKEIGDGITTNPKIMETTGDLSKGFKKACEDILNRFPNVPVSLETDLNGIPVQDIAHRVEEVKNNLLKQAYSLSKLGENVVVKIPICEGGILATKELSQKGIKTNVTACMTPYQALKAADAGATYVSLFANRMLDSHILDLANHSLEEIITNPNWKTIVKNNKETHFDEAWKRTLEEIAYVAIKLESQKSYLIVGSIRSPEDIYKISTAKPQVITIPHKIGEELKNIKEIKQTKRKVVPCENLTYGNSLEHPMTTYTLEEFETAAKSYGQ